MSEVRIRPRSGKDFARGVKYARKMGGRYDAETKTWLVSSDRPELGALGAYGLEVAPTAPTPVAKRVDPEVQSLGKRMVTAARRDGLSAGDIRSQLAELGEQVNDLHREAAEYAITVLSQPEL